MWDGYLIEVRRYRGELYIGTEYVARTGRKFLSMDEKILRGELFQTLREAVLYQIFCREKIAREGERTKVRIVPARAWNREVTGN